VVRTHAKKAVQPGDRAMTAHRATASTSETCFRADLKISRASPVARPCEQRHGRPRAGRADCGSQPTALRSHGDAARRTGHNAPRPLSLNVAPQGLYSDDMPDEQLGLDSVAAEHTVVSVFEQIVAVLARQANAAITDTTLFRLADTLFAAFARAGEDGLTAEQIRVACGAFFVGVVQHLCIMAVQEFLVPRLGLLPEVQQTVAR
jgi:hypothetical protein